MSTLPVAALDYARLGLPVLPLVPGGKAPLGRLVRHGHRGASTDPAQVSEWWRAEPTANIGVRCDSSSFDALDVDEPDGMASLHRLVTLNGRIATSINQTPHGYHFLFLPGALPTTTGRVARGLDTRGGGTGYIVMPPSVSANGGIYREAVDHPVAEAAHLCPLQLKEETGWAAGPRAWV